jgi:transcriptional regulator with XRE-family HTH domain
MTINRTLLDLRIEKRLKPVDVARTLATYPNNIAKWEKGISDPSLETLMVLLKIYEVTADELIAAWQEGVKQALANEKRTKKSKQEIIWSVGGEEAKSDISLSDLSPSATLEDLRLRVGLKPIDVARSLNAYPTNVSRWEDGSTDPGIEALVILKKIYRVTSDEFIAAWQQTVKLGLASGARKKKPKTVIIWSVKGEEEVEVEELATEVKKENGNNK